MQLLIANISIIFLHLIFGIDSSFIRLSFVFCSSFSHCRPTVDPLFVHLSFIFCSSFHYLPVRLAPARVARTGLSCYDLAPSFVYHSLFLYFPFTFYLLSFT
ncbi:hypothetical protein HMPREF9078_02082 [Capnocytophaga sp. oral taxon 380 str. F0488]|nr:hypothetical protein HMPREF9078_02082 [Capnocytophaga sp. oral taxon 380 str. F0488]